MKQSLNLVLVRLMLPFLIETSYFLLFYFVEFAAASPVCLLGFGFDGADTPSHPPPRAFTRTTVATMRCPLICVATRSLDRSVVCANTTSRYPTRPALYLFMAFS